MADVREKFATQVDPDVLAGVRKLAQQDPSARRRPSAPKYAGTIPAGSITERHRPLSQRYGIAGLPPSGTRRGRRSGVGGSGKRQGEDGKAEGES